MIRGAVCFALVLKAQKMGAHSQFEGEETILTSVLAIVIITTVIFGSLTPLLSKTLMPDVEKQKEIRRLKRLEREKVNEIK